MSDYEGEVWDPVDLSTNQTPIQHNLSSLNESILPRTKVTQNTQSRHVSASTKDRALLRPRLAKTFQPLLQNIKPKAHRRTGGCPIETHVEYTSRDQRLEAYDRFEAKPDSPDEVYELDIAWKSLLRAITETAEFRSRDIGRNNLDNISVFSEAFIKTPDPNSTRIEIWGTQEQCQKAKARLRAWEGHLRSTGTRPSQMTWTKENAYDGRKEDRKRQELWQDLEDRAIQEFDDTYFGFEAYLVWPAGHDLDAYIEKYEACIFKEIATEFRCRFQHDREADPRYTKIQAITEHELLSVYQRLINLVKEMVASRNCGAHGNFSRLPSPATYREAVVVEEIEGMKPTFYCVELTGSGMSEDKVSDWEDAVKFYDKQNRAELLSSIEDFLNALHVSQCHLRLRVSFGDLLLRSFSRANDRSLIFEFGDFLEMLQGKRTKLSDPILQDHHGDMMLLADKLSSMEEFQHLTEAYKQTFEFKGSDASNRLRLEIEMQSGYDFDEPQISSKKWLTFKTHRRNENILGLRVHDFERPGYMIRADSWDIFTNKNTIEDMEAFCSAVNFKPSRDGIKAYPKLRSTFPNHDKLVTVTEVTVVKFQFKDTDGVVEVRREDVYMQDKTPPSRLPDSTHFELHYYYPEWDNLLADFSNIKPGETVEWQQELQTFFPDHIDPNFPRSLPKGFKSFMREVHELQDLLKEVLSYPADKNGH